MSNQQPCTFARVSMKHPNIETPLEYGWLLKLETFEEMIAFFTDRDWVVRRAFLDMQKVDGAAARGYKQHFTDPTAMWADWLGEGKQGFVGLLSKWNAERFLAMGKQLPVYINRNGGWMPVNGCTEHEVKVADRWPLMENEAPRYIRFMEGKHWYVKVGVMDVEVDGQCKWNTKEAAERAYAKWLERRES